MPFFPLNTVLNTVNEFTNLSHTITYTETIGATGLSPGIITSYPVTITAVTPNNTIIVAGNTISGYYSEAFVNDIKYRTKSDTFVNVPKFKDINTETLSEVIYYYADTTTRKVFQYTATANSQTQTYTINLDNDWTSGRDELLKYAKPSKYTDISITWINSSSGSITWTNGASETLTWVNNV
jgi:hypothetical protein